jgi:TIR domain
LIFLSYAEEDGEVAAGVVAALRRGGVSVYDWRENHGTRIAGQIESKIAEATGYLALMSRRFQASAWCRREFELALVRDNESTRQPEWPFIYVLAVGDADHRDAGFIGAYDWVTLDNLDGLTNKLAGLSAPGDAGHQAADAGAPAQRPIINTYAFRNRQDEIDRVIHGLDSLSGSHFWLVIAPPQLGKSWFIGQIGRIASQHPTRPWVTKLADVRDYSPERRSDVGMILGQLFGKSAPVSTDPDSLDRLAQEIIGNTRQHLCLLDGAELLDRVTTIRLRRCLSQIYDDVRNCGDINVRLALIVASRTDDEWRGVTPVPRLEPVRLTEFKQIVVEDALRDLAEQMSRSYPPSVRIDQARLVQELSQGLPALLVACLGWIREDQWVQLNRWVRSGLPADRAVFDLLANPYIEKGLLSQDGLMPGVRDRLEQRMAALEHTFRVLVPYRLLTMSHLRHHLGTDQALGAAMERAGWELEGLWDAISGTALLSRPLNEPWQALDGTVRRLLYRHFYTSDADKIGAQQRARGYLQEWVSGQTGPEQVIGLIECLWHEAEMLRLRSPGDMERVLCRSARQMFGSLQPSQILSETELRSFGARRIREDDELAATLSTIDGLLDRLTDIAEGHQEP